MRFSEGEPARQADAAWLAQALQAARADTLGLNDCFVAALGEGLAVPLRAELNPPLWELGHIGWFQAHWLMHNPQWRQGLRADPAACLGVADDALYDSSAVPHDSRWHLPLPSRADTRAALAQQLALSLRLLSQADGSAEQLYFFRLALLHEDMHIEAALQMAQGLGVPVNERHWQPSALGANPQDLRLPAARWQRGETPAGFAFDNELGPQTLDLPAYEIAAQVLRWADYLPMVEAGLAAPPRHLRRPAGGPWQQQVFGLWQDLTLDLPACHLSAFEAQAWCAWAGRRLPTEAEWERAAFEQGEAFAWGQVWEWTASSFQPYGDALPFKPHPYRDYSVPWFGSRRVLRGASFATQARMRHLRYRNFFTPERSDVFAGFRSCAC